MSVSVDFLDEDSRLIVEFMEMALVTHQECLEDCTCADPMGDCWYRLSEKEKNEQRIDYVIHALQDLKELILDDKEKQPEPENQSIPVDTNPV